MTTIKTARRHKRKPVKYARKPEMDRELTAPTRGRIAAVEHLFAQIPRDELTAALESSDDDRAARLRLMMDDPAWNGKRDGGMAVKIRACGLTVPETLKLITGMYRSDADLRVARRLPSILERMAIESEPHLVPCPRCSAGTRDDIADGVYDELVDDEPKRGRRCRRCNGKKQVMKSADNEVRKMVLETQNLLGGKGPLIDARSVNIYSGAPDMTDWSKRSDDDFERNVPRLPPKPESTESEIDE
jgi:hypothetical protein